jgi:hypothetical protein
LRHVAAVLAGCEEAGIGPDWALEQHAERLGVSLVEALDAVRNASEIDLDVPGLEAWLLRIAVERHDAVDGKCLFDHLSV